MDPPEEDDELASLMEETLNDNVVRDEADDAPTMFMPPRPTRSKFGNRSSPTRRQQQRQHQQPTPDAGGSTLLGVRSRIVFLLLNLAGIVLLLVIVANKTESATEIDAATSKVGVHHFDRPGSAVNATPSSNKGDEKPSSTSASASTAAGDGQYIGFHEPSIENIYGANRYYKPKGVGYPISPQGGLHPIYMNEISDEEKKQLSEEKYFDDNYELSPYADVRLKLSDEARKAEQADWEKKLQDIRDKYGYWNFHDDYPTKNNGKDRPVVDWTTVGEKNTNDYNPLFGEINKQEFPKDSWQTEDVYITNFLSEGKKLIKRMIQAINDEYGTEAGVQLTKADGSKRNVGGGNAWAWMYEDSFNALAKKLLNAMMTNNHFYVILGGHSAAAGHGNNFYQSYMMEFQRVMEPVFDRLGMVLVSANRAQGGMGTLQAALAGNGIYGERDFMLWDSSMTEKDGKAQDVFLRQALLSGQRVPVLFDMGGGRGMMDRIRKEVGAHIGGIAGGNMFPKYTNTTFDFGIKEHKYNAKCWTERVDVKVDVQYPTYGGQASWHPGNFVHQASARKMSVLFLQALDEALSLWEKAASTDGNPLDGKHWHLQAEEEKIRDALKGANAAETECGKLFTHIPRVCTTPMRGAAEWAPRADADHSSIRSLAKPSPTRYLPQIIGVQEQAYPGRDPKMPEQRVPKGEVDVATIARSLPPRTTRKRRLVASQHHDNSKHAIRTSQTLSDASRSSSLQALHGRRLDGNSTKVIPGEGWSGQGHPAGYCDGTLNALCYREKSNHCIMSNHNDARGVMVGDALSGWLILQFKDVTQGIVLSRMEAYHAYKSNKRTDGWEKVNNGRDDGRRKLKAPPPPLPDDFRFEAAVNGEILYSWNKTEYSKNCPYLSYNNNLCKLWDDEKWATENKKEDVEFGLRVTSQAGRNCMMAFTHIYYA